jgi:hypothetical protein
VLSLRDLVVLELEVCNVGIRSLFSEDLPSGLLNASVILLEMRTGSKADGSLFASFAALLFSAGMAGRKSGLRQQRRELKQKKADTEQMIRMHTKVTDARKSHSRLISMNESLVREKEELEEEMRLKKHSEEELKVMVAALESVSKERQDELKEVMIDSKELQVGKLLGKGG